MLQSSSSLMPGSLSQIMPSTSELGPVSQSLSPRQRLMHQNNFKPTAAVVTKDVEEFT